MPLLKPNHNRAKTAIIMVGVVALASFAELISECMQLNLLQVTRYGVILNNEVATENDSRQALFSNIKTVCYCLSAFTFLAWFRRAYNNLGQLTEYLSYREYWTIFSWFVPFMNLVRPYKIMKELFWETGDVLERHDMSCSVRLKFSLVGWWWAVWISDATVAWVMGKLIRRGELTYEHLILISQLSIAGSILSIILSLVTILLIRNMALAENALYLIAEQKERQEVLESPV